MDRFRKCFAIILFLLISIVSKAQTKHYKVVWRGDSVGYINAYKFDSANFEVYKIKSEVSFWFFGRRLIKTEYSETFKDQKLVSSDALFFKDDELREECLTIRNSSHYDISLDDEKLEPIFDPIGITTTTLYFQQPGIAASFVFSERHGVMMPLEKINESSYRIEKPNGRYNDYIYENGICERVKVDNIFATLYFIRIHEDPDKNL